MQSNRSLVGYATTQPLEVAVVVRDVVAVVVVALCFVASR